MDLYQGERKPDMGSEGSWKKRVSWEYFLGPFDFGFVFGFGSAFALGLVVVRALFLMLESFADLEGVLVVGRLVLVMVALLVEG